MVEWWQCRRAPLAWWALAGSVAVALKWQFSAAAASDLQWMLHPLALLLRALTGWHFLRDDAGNWECPAAGFVLVKACAGVNFMLLSFLGWCWLWRPVPATGRASARPWATGQWPLRLGGALLCGWLAALAVNALRVVLVVRGQPGLEQWLAPADAHRLIGLLTYLPALSLQWSLAERGAPGRGALLAAGAYAVLLLGVPLASGGAAADPRHFAAHLGWVAAVLAPLAGYGCWRANCRAPRFRGS
ncbi:MAG TPA: hypothetical protein VMT49_05445 [Steroidobacteraceae bacterium]|nr:hypothetical protein [Steroidobacteraceae bacterium]